MVKIFKWVILKIIQAIKWVINECKDRTTLIIFAIVWVIMMTPAWGGYLLSIITSNPWHIAYATAYIIFWAGPFTPFLPLCLVITITIKKIFKIKSKSKSSPNKQNDDNIIDAQIYQHPDSNDSLED